MNTVWQLLHMQIKNLTFLTLKKMNNFFSSNSRNLWFNFKALSLGIIHEAERLFVHKMLLELNCLPKKSECFLPKVLWFLAMWRGFMHKLFGENVILEASAQRITKLPLPVQFFIAFVAFLLLVNPNTFNHKTTSTVNCMVGFYLWPLNK